MFDVLIVVGYCENVNYTKFLFNDNNVESAVCVDNDENCLQTTSVRAAHDDHLIFNSDLITVLRQRIIIFRSWWQNYNIHSEEKRNKINNARARVYVYW